MKIKTVEIILRKDFQIFLIFCLFYFFIAYKVIPTIWHHYEHFPAMEALPKTSRTVEGIEGDPLNIGFVGSKEEIINALERAGWLPADPITWKTSFRISTSVIMKRSYPTAPVSNLYLWERGQDLSFEKQVGNTPGKRHHLRLWQANGIGIDQRPLWVGDATFDRKVGISHYTGQITHHIAPDVDRERDQVTNDLKEAHELIKIYQVTGVGPTLNTRNGGGDHYFTDGELTIGEISINNKLHVSTPSLPNPLSVEIKNRAWLLLQPVLKSITEKQNAV